MLDGVTMATKKNPLNLNPLQLKTLTLLQELARFSGPADGDGSVRVDELPHPHGDHFHVGEGVASTRDATGLANQSVWIALERKGLIRSEFPEAAIVTAEGLAYEYLDGKTRDREARVRRFQEDPSCGLFLVSLKAGGLGLNLTAAEYVFLLDPWWNPAVEAQAIDRAHRIGQTRHVFAYRLLAADTVEDKIVALQQSKRELAAEGLGLKVWDAYRPYAVTVAMWEAIRDPDYVADPAKGSRHNRGCAVDLSLYHLDSGREAEMPSAYDEFSPRADPNYAGGTAEQRARRDLLRRAMEKEGFTVEPNEWWHFNCRDWRSYPILDVPFEALPPAAAR